MTGENLKSILFCYQTSMTVSIDNFDTVSKGYIEVRLSHHDRPMGETMYIVQAEEDDEFVDEDTFWEKLYSLGLEERPHSYTMTREEK